MISVIMPVKNGGKYLKRALNSLQKQTDYEVLFCDGGSNDNTLDIVNQYSIKPISYSDKSTEDAINIGITYSKGDILTWLMYDDELLPNAFETVSKFFADNPDILWAYSPCELRYPEHSIWMGTDPEITLEKMLKQNQISGVAVYFRPEFFEKCGRVDTDYHVASDYELWLRAVSMGVIPKQIPTPTVIYHAHGDNQGMRPAGVEESQRAINKYSNAKSK